MDARHPVVVWACGEPRRGDDGVAARALTPPFDCDRAVLRVTDAIAPEDLIGVRAGTRSIIVDAVVGPAPGCLVRIPFDELTARASEVAPVSSHQLPLPLVVGLAHALGAQPVGVFLGVGVASVALGEGLSDPVLAALPRLRAAIRAEVERLSRGQVAPVYDAAAAGAAAGGR